MLKSAQNKEIIFFRRADGNEPFGEWVEDIRDAKTRRRILQRVFRMQTGNYGDCKSLKEGVFELRLMFGPGYRIFR